MSDERRRLEVGFEGGSVLRLTVEEAEAERLVGALAGGGWSEVASDEGTHWLNLGEVRYLRLVPGGALGRVGFSGV